MCLEYFHRMLPHVNLLLRERKRERERERERVTGIIFCYFKVNIYNKHSSTT